jgi:hypothetical protein
MMIDMCRLKTGLPFVGDTYTSKAKGSRDA